MKQWMAVVMAAALFGPAADGLAQSHHGGGPHNPPPSGPGPHPSQQQPPTPPTPPPPPDPAEVQKQTAAHVVDLLASGFAHLKAGEPSAAYDDFADVLQLQTYNGQAFWGMGLVHAAKGRWDRAQTAMEVAVQNKVDPRLSTLDQAVTYARGNQKNRALVVLNTYFTNHAKDPIDELLHNAELSVLNSMTDAQRQAVAILPQIQKNIDKQQEGLAAAHPGLLRWGLDYKTADEVAKLKESGAKELFPEPLPLLLPDGSVLPEGGAPAVANLLLAGASGAGGKAGGTSSGGGDTGVKTADASGSGAAVTGSGPGAVPPTGGAGATSGSRTGGDIAKATTPDPTPVKLDAPLRITHGAAFAVGPDLLVTCDRLVADAADIFVEAVDGQTFTATVVARDGARGLALLKVKPGKAAGNSGGTSGGGGDYFTPMSLAKEAKPGAVRVAAFPRATVFQPHLELLSFTLGVTADKQPVLRGETHPRTAGSPVLNDKGQVIGVFSGSRDDFTNQLPFVTLEALRQFADNKFSPADAAPGTAAAPGFDPAESVVEITVRQKG